MGRNRLPKAVHELRGTFEKHPEREAQYANEPKPVSMSLGSPPVRWLPHPRAAEAAALFIEGKDTYSVAQTLGMTYDQAKALRPGSPPGEEMELLEAWNDIVAQAPPGVLTFSDRLWVETTCYAMVRIRNKKAKGSDFSIVKEFLGKMAMNPADRPKIQLNAGGGAAAPSQSDASTEQNTFAQIAAEVRDQSRQSRPN
jgi:hypothetical protein